MIDGIDAEGFQSDLESFLWVDGLDRPRFRKLPDPRRRFDGTARLSEDPARVGRRLVRRWLQELALERSEAHLTEIVDGALVFEFITWGDKIGCAAGRLTATVKR